MNGLSDRGQPATRKETAKAPRYHCHYCQLTAPAPIVVPVPNPINAEHGRCSNRQACASRIRRATNKRKETKHA